MYEKRIKTVQDMIDILNQVSDPKTTLLIMSDDLKLEYDEENNVMVLRDEPQGNLKMELPPPFDVFNLAHVYETSVGTVKINMFDVTDDDMVMVFADPAYIPDEGPFHIVLGQLTDIDGDWQQVIGLIYADSVIGYGLHVSAEISEESLTAALENMLNKDADGNFVSRVLQEYHDYYRAVLDLYARCYIPATEENDVLLVDMTLHEKGPLYVTYSISPITDGERERVNDPDCDEDFGVCIMWSGGTPIIQYGLGTRSRSEVEQHKLCDADCANKCDCDITTAIRNMMYNLEDLICSNR